MISKRSFLFYALVILIIAQRVTCTPRGLVKFEGDKTTIEDFFTSGALTSGEDKAGWCPISGCTHLYCGSPWTHCCANSDWCWCCYGKVEQ